MKHHYFLTAPFVYIAVFLNSSLAGATPTKRPFLRPPPPKLYSFIRRGDISAEPPPSGLIITADSHSSSIESTKDTEDESTGSMKVMETEPSIKRVSRSSGDLASLDKGSDSQSQSVSFLEVTSASLGQILAQACSDIFAREAVSLPKDFNLFLESKKLITYLREHNPALLRDYIEATLYLESFAENFPSSFTHTRPTFMAYELFLNLLNRRSDRDYDSIFRSSILYETTRKEVEDFFEEHPGFAPHDIARRQITPLTNIEISYPTPSKEMDPSDLDDEGYEKKE